MFKIVQTSCWKLYDDASVSRFGKKRKKGCEGKWGNLTVKFPRWKIWRRAAWRVCASLCTTFSTYGGMCKFLWTFGVHAGEHYRSGSRLAPLHTPTTIVLDTNFKKLYCASHSLGTSYFPDKNSWLLPSPVNIKEDTLSLSLSLPLKRVIDAYQKDLRGEITTLMFD